MGISQLVGKFGVISGWAEAGIGDGQVYPVLLSGAHDLHGLKASQVCQLYAESLVKKIFARLTLNTSGTDCPLLPYSLTFHLV